MIWEFSLSSIQLYALLNIISSSSDALSRPALKVFNDMFAHSPWNIFYEVFAWPLKFCHILWVMVAHVFATSHRKKSSGLRSGERGDHGKPFFYEINSSRSLIVAVAAWDVAPSCWNHWLSNRRSWRRYNNPWKMWITLRYRSWLIDTLTPCSRNHRGPIMPLAIKARHAVHLPLWRGRSLSFL